MTEPTDAELDAVLCKHWPAFSMQATLVRMWVRAAMRDAIAKWDTPPAEQQASPKAAPTRTALPEGWTDCTIEFGNDGAEVVAYGPKRMMTRLAKWLGKYFAQVIADAAPKAAPGGPSADSLRHQNKLLAETLGACILASGIVRKNIDGFTGPELLHFGKDLRSMLEAAPQQEAQEPFGYVFEEQPAPAPPPECETEAEKRAFAFGWFKALESERMKADNKKKAPL